MSSLCLFHSGKGEILDISLKTIKRHLKYKKTSGVADLLFQKSKISQRTGISLLHQLLEWNVSIIST